MSFKIAEGYVEVTADGRPIPGKVANDINSNGSAFDKVGHGIGGRIVAGTLGAIAAVGIGSKIAEFFSSGITYSSDLAETVNKSSVIFGDSQSQIDSWASTSVYALGLSREAAIGTAARFGDIFTQVGFTSDAAADMSTAVVQAAADLGSFSNLETADVADRMAAAFRGEYDSLKAVIPGISAARVESEALAMTGKTTAASLTAQEKAAAVLAIVQTDGARAMGDFAKTSDGYANQQKIMAAQTEELSGKFGSLLLPIMSNLVGFMNTSVIPALSGVASWVSENSQVLGFLASIVGGAVAAFTAYKLVMLAIQAPTMIATAAQWLWNVALSANPIGIIITAIGALVGALIYFFTQTELGQQVWTNITSFIGTAMTWLWESVLKPVIDALAAAWDWLYNTIILPIVTGIMIYIGLWAAIFTWLWETILAPIFGAIGAVFGWLWTNVIEPIIGFISAYIQALGLVFSWLWESAISPAFQAVAAGFDWVWKNAIKPVVDFISGAIQAVGNTVSSVFGGIASFIGSAFSAVLGVVKGPINAIISLINGAISGLNSISVTIPSWVPIVGGQRFGINIPKLPMLAKGGIFRDNGWAVVGENGPELVQGVRGASVQPLPAGMPVGSGGGTTVIVEKVSIDASTVDDFNRVVSIMDNVGQEARKGRGNSGGGF